MEPKPLIKPQPRKGDHFLIGFFSGMLLPVFVILLYYKSNLSFIQPESFLLPYFLKKIFAPLVSLCVTPNLGLFFLFLHFNRLRAARGVIGITLLYAACIFIFKFTVEA
ncbi:MAG: hypothetical protein RLZZ46_1713 [Bacteroidota bacterium]|jgi:hypothetical protein